MKTSLTRNMSSSSLLGSQFSSKKEKESENNFLSSERHPHPPTPPVNKTKSLKNQQRFATDRLSSSAANTESSIENTPVHLHKSRSDSTDSGLVSGGANKRRSMDSGLSHRFKETESDGPSPDACPDMITDIHRAPTNPSSSTIPRDDESENPYCPRKKISFHNKAPSNEKYLSTASDKAADREVSSILKRPIEGDVIWPDSPPPEPSPISHPDPPNISNDLLPSLDNPRTSEHSPLFHRHRDVASLLRQKRRHNKRLCEGKSASADEKSPRNSSFVTLTDSECVGQSNPIPSHRHKNKRDEDHYRASIPPKAKTRLHSPVRVDSHSSILQNDANRRISSSDTHRSSIRYEPVVTDHGFSPPSPTHHDNRRIPGLNKSTSSRSRVGSGSEEDEIENDISIVPLRDEERSPLNLQRRGSSPNVDPRVQHPRGTAYTARNNPENNPYAAKSASSANDLRHHGVPRMGTGGILGANTSHNPNHLSSTSHNQQTVGTAVTSRLSSLGQEGFPVGSSAIKPAYVDESHHWSYIRGSETDRSQIGGYASGCGLRSGGQENNTAARFMNKRPSFTGRSHFDSGHHTTRDGGFKKFKSGCWRKCSWKCTAIAFILISILLLALSSYFIVQTFNHPVTLVNAPNSKQCFTADDTVVSTVPHHDGSTVELQLKRRSNLMVPPGVFSRVQMYVEEPKHLKFNCTVSPRAELAIYGRKGFRPTHTKFDFFEKVDGSLLPSAVSTLTLTSRTSLVSMETSSGRRSRRSVSPPAVSFNVQFLEYLEAGTWHIAIFNDGKDEEVFSISTSISEGLSKCPGSCNNNGDCINGVCSCFPGFQGKDCSQVSCAVTCRGNGVYALGACACFSGWKGVDCGTPTDQCVVPNCGGHGECGPDGECVCERGYKGDACEEVDCIDPSCSQHGICLLGQCRCDRGWKGTLCSEEDTLCIVNCGGHGTFDQVTKKCICEAGWAGSDCNIASCRPSCDVNHGVCVDGACRCDDGWTGDACDVRKCHARCEEHGNCVRGVCVCDMGWNGDLCTFSGCPNDCSGHGNCITDSDGGWYCSCRTGWKGSGCTVDMETHCTDGRDNDRDSLIDCQDPDCCSHRSCSKTTQCRGGLDPAHEITRIRGRSTSSTASFFDRMKFLIHRNGVQLNSDISLINPSRASVIRGQVVTKDGSPLVGVQVKVSGQEEYGFTKTRVDGWYELLVNGGGSLTLSFQRSSFVRNVVVVVFVPWNDFVIAPTATMRTPRDPSEPDVIDENCDVSKFPQPSASVLISSVRAYTAAECSEKGSIIPEMQAIREAVTLPSTQTSLVYLSSRALGYQSVLILSLIAGEKPVNLLQVTVEISVQGKQFNKKFEPVSDLKYTYEWSREDAYGQRVYGSVKAQVMVGYLYESCDQMVWKRLSAVLQGYAPSQRSSIGHWTFDIHHAYHPEKGVVYLGNGGEMRLREQPPMMRTVMGNGKSRHVTCDRCDGTANATMLMSPVALATDAAGNLYIGDNDFIRKIDVEGDASSLYSTRNAPSKYYMAVSPVVGGPLYFSHPTERRIYKLRRMSMPKTRRSHDLSSNQEVVAGSGIACYPLQKDNCGDGGPALSARLSSPKGLAIDKTGRLFFVDGSRIRTIDPKDNKIDTLAGSLLLSNTRPLYCDGSMSLDQLELNFPTALTISPLDGALYVLDGDVVVKIDLKSRQASLVAGVPHHCARAVARYPDIRDARKVQLISPTSISVSPLDGALYIAETDQKFVHRVRRVEAYSGRISTVAGIDSDCDCAVQGCQCFEGDGDFARSASLNNPTAIALGPDGSLYIADQLNLRIRKVLHSVPALTNGKYSISDPDTNQVYLFDRYGRHLETKNVITGTKLYRFSYASQGLLTTITDVNGNTLRVEYATGGRPIRLSLPNRESIGVDVNQGGFLMGVTQGSTRLAAFTYQGEESGLIRSSVRGQYASTFYVYDVHGRLMSVTSSTGSMTSLHTKMNATKHTVTMETAATSVGDDSGEMGVGRRDVVITTEPGYLCDIITTVEGAMTTTYKRWTDNSISVHYLDDSELILETKPHPVLGLTAPFLAKRTIQLPSDPLENKIEWQTRNEKESGFPAEQFLLGRRMRVNDRNILSLDYSQGLMMEKIYDDHTKFMLRVQYNDRGLPTLWMPQQGITPVNVTYDASGHAVTWQRGPDNEEVRYDMIGNLQSTKFPDGTIWRYTYGDKIAHLSLPASSLQYTFTYDDNSNLRRVSIPSGLFYTIDERIGIGFIRTTISGPDDVFTVIEDHNDRGNALSVFYPGEKRKVLFRYDTHGHMTEILHDSTRTRMLRDPQSGELVSVSTKDCTMRFHRNGPLVQRYVITSVVDGGLLAVFDYTHDVNLRLSSLEVKVNGTRLPVEHLSYNDVSGKLTTFGAYRIIDLPANIYAIGNQEVTLNKELDNNGRITETALEAYSVLAFHMLISYDNGGRVSSQEMKVGMYGNTTRKDYTYTRNGALNTMAEDGVMRWRYGYDMDGKLVLVEHRGTRSTLRYDGQGRLTSYGDLQYDYDDDGFLRQRGDEVFEYDSMSHLILAYRLDNSYKIKYGYDGFGRLATRVDVTHRNTIRYLYGDIMNPTRLTHVYNATSGLVTTLRYDVEGHLFSLDRSDQVTWSVVCDQSGTPVAALDRTSFVAKELKYSPFGQVLSDTAPAINLHIGFRGGIYDAITGLVHFNDRSVLSPLIVPGISSAEPLIPQPTTEQSTGRLQQGVEYDPLTGQFTSSGIIRLKQAAVTAQPFRMYQIIDPVNHEPKYNHMTDTNSWLNALGFKLQNVAPDPQIASRQKDKSSAECQLSHHLSTYMSLQTATPSVLVPGSGRRDAPTTPGGTLFAQGLVVSVDRGQVSTQVLDSATNDVKRLSGIINGAEVMVGKNTDSVSAAMSLTLEGKPTLYLAKPASSLAKDQQTMRLVNGHERILDSAYNDESSLTSPIIAVLLQDSEIRAESGYAIVSIIYVNNEEDSSSASEDFSSLSQEHDRIMEQAVRRAESEAWLREKTKIQSGLRTRWSQKEEREILSSGRLTSYSVRLTWNPEIYPELADSGRNIKFVRNT